MLSRLSVLFLEFLYVRMSSWLTEKKYLTKRATKYFIFLAFESVACHGFTTDRKNCGMLRYPYSAENNRESIGK